MSEKKLEIDNLKIFTLNCWGLRYVSDHRQVRIKLIAQHLVEQDYDIVFLQEVWIQSDFEYIRTKTKSKFRFAHMFHNASLLGTSGLVIMSKWTPQFIHFHPYSINGSPFRPFHGDWFSTKGVAYVRIELIGLNLHLFCTHMHAQYDQKEKIIDQYSIHRICQSYELAKFINLMACNCMNTGSKDLILLAGDMNTSSKELPYKMLSMFVCFVCFFPDKLNKKYSSNNNKQLEKLKSLESINDHESSDEELTTCGHRDNTFTPQQYLQSEKKIGKRIDFIFFKLRDSSSPSDHHRYLHNHFENNTMDLIKNDFDTIFSNNENNLVTTTSTNNNANNQNQNPNRIEQTSFLMCLPEKVNVVAKDISGLSFSDHQPVVAKLHFQWKTIKDLVNESNNYYYKNNTSDNTSDDRQLLNNKAEEMNSSFLETSNGLSQSQSQTSPSSPTSTAMKMNDKKSTQAKLFSAKLRRKECYLALREYQPMFKKIRDSSLINEIETLLNAYVEKFLPSFNYTLITVLIMIIIFIMLLISFKFLIPLTFVETILMSLIFMIIATIGLLLKFITHRTEINAIKAILNDIQRKRTFHPDYGLRNNDNVTVNDG
uniref:sphingomyelin phosphodiesterase n=1 Tax=Dermatophagoides pteronyssinus TaxID=6956 RepID=A0A6P6XZJ1_DERPT|nr:uncharacterized protein LOC113792949 [Dermatophagoides pteronyssinus]